MIISGLVGTVVGNKLRGDEELGELLHGIRRRHWFWLWIALYAWVAILPTCGYFIWLEVISAGYVLIHPSLWFSEAWSVGWTFSFGMSGIAIAAYGVELSLRNVSLEHAADKSLTKRVLLFLLGTAILAGPVSNVLLRIAIHSLKHLPDGITTNPWWVLR